MHLSIHDLASVTNHGYFHGIWYSSSLQNTVQHKCELHENWLYNSHIYLRT